VRRLRRSLYLSDIPKYLMASYTYRSLVQVLLKLCYVFCRFMSGVVVGSPPGRSSLSAGDLLPVHGADFEADERAPPLRTRPPSLPHRLPPLRGVPLPQLAPSPLFPLTLRLRSPLMSDNPAQPLSVHTCTYPFSVFLLTLYK
jgi:hypothetical protein